MRSNAARGNVLRALGREMSSRARSARVKLGELSGAELAIGGIGGLGAIVAGGLLLSNLSGSSGARGTSGASGVGGVTGDLDTAKMRQMDTTDLLDYFSRTSEPERQKVADFCVCRVHDLRDLRVQKEYQDAAKQVLERLAEELRGVPNPSPCKQAQLEFLESAIKVNEPPKPLYGGFDTELVQVRAKRNVKMLAPERRLYQAYNWGQGSWPIATSIGFSELVGKVGIDGKHVYYGHIATWDVRNVERMDYAFSYRDLKLGIEHWEDLSFWDTRSVSNEIHVP